MKTINELLNPVLEKEFCRQNKCDFLTDEIDGEGNHIVVGWYQYDIYPAACEPQDIFTYDEIQEWLAQEEQRHFQQLIFCDEMCITPEDLKIMLEYELIKLDLEIQEQDYYDEWIDEIAWYNHARSLGWE